VLCSGKFPSLEGGPKTQPLVRDGKKQKFTDLTEKGKLNDKAHCSIIQVYTVFFFAFVSAED